MTRIARIENRTVDKLAPMAPEAEPGVQATAAELRFGAGPARRPGSSLLPLDAEGNEIQPRAPVPLVPMAPGGAPVIDPPGEHAGGFSGSAFLLLLKLVEQVSAGSRRAVRRFSRLSRRKP